MAIGVGFNSWISYVAESTWGTWVTPTKSIKIISEDFKLEDPPQPRKSLGVATQLGYYQGRKSVAGSFTAEMLYSGFEAFLYHAMGAVADSGTTNYTHTYTVADPLPEGLSIETEKDAAYWRWEGCMVNEMTLDMTDMEILQGTFGFIGEDQNAYATGTGTAASFPTDDPILPWTDATYSFSATLDGAAVTGGIREAHVTLNNQLSGDRPNLGSRLIQQPVRNSWVEVSGNFVADFRAESIAEIYDDFVNGAAVNIVLTYAKDANTSLEVRIPKAKYSGETPAVGGPDVLSINVPFVGEYDATTGTSLQVVLKNQTANGQTG